MYNYYTDDYLPGGFPGGYDGGMYYHGLGGVEEILRTIVVLYGLIIVVWGIISFAGYILRGIGLYRIAQRMGKENPWLSFVPFGRTYLLGEVSGPVEIGKRQITSPGIWLIVLPIIFSVIAGIMYFFIAMVTVMSLAIGGGGFSILLTVLFGLLFLAVTIAYTALNYVMKGLVNLSVIRHFTTENTAVAHMICFMFIPLYAPIYLFAARNRPFTDIEEKQECNGNGPWSHPGQPWNTPGSANGQRPYPNGPWQQPVTPEQPVAPQPPVTPEQPVAPQSPVTPQPPVTPGQPAAPQEQPVQADAQQWTSEQKDGDVQNNESPDHQED